MKKFLVFIICLSIFTSNSFASEVQEKVYLTQIFNQLNAMQPLVIAAQKAQPANTRLPFHYTQYQDNKGKLHNGLLDDIKAIQIGIRQKLNNTAVEPRVFAPIKGDYLAK